MSDAVVGVLGTILGTVTGFVLSEVSKAGRIKILQEGMAALKGSVETEPPEFLYEGTGRINIYNSGVLPRSMQNIRLIFYSRTSPALEAGLVIKEFIGMWDPPKTDMSTDCLRIDGRSVLQLYLKFHKRTDNPLGDDYGVYLQYENEYGKKKYKKLTHKLILQH